jgi:hypothetical protein
MYAPTYQQEKEPEKMTRWQKIKRGVCITLAAIGSMIGVIWYTAPDTPHAAPVPYEVLSTGNWRLLEARDASAQGVKLHVEAGFDQWDGLSIPAQATNSLKVTRYCYPEASLWHDGCYASRLVSKAVADAGLREILLRSGCATNRTELIVTMLDAWGWGAFDYKTEESIRRAREFVTVRSKP